jgi:hypothetical protein
MRLNPRLLIFASLFPSLLLQGSVSPLSLEIFHPFFSYYLCVEVSQVHLATQAFLLDTLIIPPSLPS